MSDMVIKVTGPRSYTKRIKVKGIKPEKKIKVSKDTQKLVGIRRALNDHATRLFVAEGKLTSLTCRISHERDDIDTLFIGKEQLFRRTDSLFAIAIMELLMILTLALIQVV